MIAFNISEWHSGIDTMMAAKPMIEAAVNAMPGAKVFIEYKTDGKDFMEIPGITEVYRSGNMRALVGYPKKELWKIMVKKFGMYGVPAIIGFSLGVLFDRLLGAVKGG